MSRLTWSPQALLDVQRLYRFLASKNISAAKRAVSTLREGVKLLGSQPGIGRPIDDMPNEFREWIIDYGDTGYIVRYRVDAVTVVVLTVRHQKEVGFSE
jgi:plasmid stabilization system protein ParE